MSNFKNAGQKIHNLKLKNLELEKERKTLSSEVLLYVNSEENSNQSSKLNYKAVNLTTGNTFTQKQQLNCEAQKAVEFKAKALFELEQVILGIEQFKQGFCQ